MKQKLRLTILAVLAVTMLCACGKKQTPGEDLRYTYLTGEEERARVSTALQAAGVSDDRLLVFWDHVNQYNEAVDGLLDGDDYDPYALQDAWYNAYPDFLGYNCRITAFGLMGDYIHVDGEAEAGDSYLMFDYEALNADDSALLSPNDLNAFSLLFSTVPTSGTTDINLHVAAIQQEWQARGIHFDDNAPIHLISVFFHDKWDENTNELMPGHVGVLIETGEDGLLFVEKIAFQEPYRATWFEKRGQLHDYLMEKYDTAEDQETARSFILENDKLLCADD